MTSQLKTFTITINISTKLETRTINCIIKQNKFKLQLPKTIRNIRSTQNTSLVNAL